MVHINKKRKGSVALFPIVFIVVVGLIGIVVLSSISSNKEKNLSGEASHAAALATPAADEYFIDLPDDEFDQTNEVVRALTTKSASVNLNVSKLSPIKHSASGFLVTSIPRGGFDQSYVLDLKPELFRTQSNYLAAQADFNYVMFHDKAGSDFQVFMAADYLDKYVWCTACKGKEVWPGQNGDWTAWEQSIEGVMNKILGGGYKVQYDIWNEPDVAQFWGPQTNVARFNETWKRAFQIIRRRDPQAKIVGPTVANYNKTYITNFLKYANSNNVLPNIISWHELNPDQDATQIGARVKDITEWMGTQSPKIVMDGISINEILPPFDFINSGAFVNYARALEKAGVISSTKSCWPEVWPNESTSNCWTESLDGLLTIDTHQKRGMWYTYKSYADMTGVLLETTSPAGFPIIASQDDSNGKTQILIANNASPAYNVNFKLTGTNGVGRASNNYVQVRLQSIPSNGKSALTSFPSETVYNYFVTNNTVSVSLPNFSGTGAYKVILATPSQNYPQLMPNVAISTCSATVASPIISVSWSKGSRPESKVRVVVDDDTVSTNGYYYKDVAIGGSNIVTNKFTGAGAFAGRTLTLVKNKAYNVSLKYTVTNETSPWKTFKVSSACVIS